MMIVWRAAALIGVVIGSLCGSASLAFAEPLPVDEPGAKKEASRLDAMPALPPSTAKHIDHSGRKQKGHASFYASHFAQRKMADGKRMNPNSNNAASKTLPLGSVAKVTNLENGKTATVKIEDRGPYVNGRVVDLPPKVASQLEIKQKGVAPVEVKPITIPQPDGNIRLGAGAADASPREIQQAVDVTKQLTGTKTTDAAEK